MTRNEIIQFITENNIDKDTSLVFTILENGQAIEYKGRFEFNYNGTPAISEVRVGIRIQMIEGAADMPYVGGLVFDNLVNVRVHE